MGNAENKAVRHWQLVDLHIDVASRQVRRAGQVLGLQGLSLDLLLYLLQQGQRVVAADELIQAVWQGREVSDEALTQRVKLLRQALEDDSRAPRYLRSVRGSGYQLCAQPVPLPGITAAGGGYAGVGGVIGRHQMSIVLSLVLVAMTAWLLMKPWGDSAQIPVLAEAASPAVPPLAAGQQQSSAVAVEELLRQARHYQERGQDDDNLRAIALYRQVLAQAPDRREAQVGLSHSLSQRVCLFNDAVALLVEAEALARAVIEQSQPSDNGAGSHSVSSEGAGDGHGALAHVYDCRGWVDLALAQYARALELSPADGAYLASYAYLMMVRGELVDALEANLRAAQQQQQLHFLDLQVAHVLELLGFVDAAELRYRRTFELYPDNVFGNLAYPRFLYLQGRLQHAQERLDEALTRGVPRPGLYLLQAELALLRQQPELASAALAAANQVNPHRTYAATLHRLHDEKSSQSAIQSDLPAPDSLSGIALEEQPGPAEQSLPADWKSQTMAEVQASVDAGNTWPDTWLQLALLELSQSHPAAALEALNGAVDRGFLDRNYLLISPWFAELRMEPGFLSLLERISESLRRQRQTVLSANWIPADLLLPTPTALDTVGVGVQ